MPTTLIRCKFRPDQIPIGRWLSKETYHYVILVVPTRRQKDILPMLLPRASLFAILSEQYMKEEWHVKTTSSPHPGGVIVIGEDDWRWLNNSQTWPAYA